MLGSAGFWNPGFEVLDLHALIIEVIQHCILVQFTLLDRPDHIHKSLD